jgi:hypothetical protein
MLLRADHVRATHTCCEKQVNHVASALCASQVARPVESPSLLSDVFARDVLQFSSGKAHLRIYFAAFTILASRHTSGLVELIPKLDASVPTAAKTASRILRLAA